MLDPTATAAVPAPAPISAPPTPTPAPTPEPTPGPTETLHGSATVVDNALLLEWPDPSSGLVFSVPAGSTIELLGEQNGRYVKATYMYLYGWIDLGALTDAATVRDELVPDDAEEVDVRTPRPGSGVAFTTVDLSLRAGPSATESVLAPVEAGTRVVLTGVMENGFQRVTFGDLVGWIANDYLSLPADPTPTPNPKQEDRPAYSERQVIKIIYAAADTYGQDRADMLRVARCESGLDPYAVNPSGSYGLFQFIRSTWKSTPYGQEDIFDPRANANAASWMWSQGRQAEWICK
ncbi:MAG: SH3 domain-containing protein [Thermomicrobiales bacterium]|nr:SH3 domain-containing protein [Thermomicrobiales bacterium]